MKENERMIESAKEYKKMGKEKWVQQQIRKAQDQYELHTEKYYVAKLSTPQNERPRPQSPQHKR